MEYLDAYPWEAAILIYKYIRMTGQAPSIRKELFVFSRETEQPVSRSYARA